MKKTDRLPGGVKPDVILVVAPSPEDYQEYFEGLEGILGENTEILILVEKQSQQAVSGKGVEMRKWLNGWLKRKGYEVEKSDEEGLDESFSEFLEEVGLDEGGYLNTAWEPSGKWRVYIGRR